VPRHRAALLVLLALVALAAGCRTPIREDVYNQPPVKVFLRSEKSWQFGPLVEKDYDHPVTISPVRIAHILSRIDARIAGKREPAIQTDMLYSIAEGISRALTRAGGEQEVVVMAIRKQRHLGIFDHDYLTSFVVYVRGPQMFVHLARLDWEIPKRQEEKPEEPAIDQESMSFRVYPSEGMELVSKQGLAIEYKDDIFARATRTKSVRRSTRCRTVTVGDAAVEPWPQVGCPTRSRRGCRTGTDDPYDLERFVTAQAPVYPEVVVELRAGRKHGHWMWFVFPQVRGLGLSPTAHRYGVASLDEARAYLQHPSLGRRLEECALLILGHAGRSASEILGSPDDLKLRSSMTLFTAAAPHEPLYARVLEAFYGGRPDERTLALL
jgi:uncharacterized protein (DUF1810 family)